MEAGGAGGHGHGRLDFIAVGGDQYTIGSETEGAVAAVDDVAVWMQHLKITLALNRHVEGVAGLHDIALAVLLLSGHHLDPGAEHQPGGQLGVLRRLGADLAQVLVDQIVEHRPVPFEAGGVDIGEVVRDHGHVGLLGIESGFGDPECGVHTRFLSSGDLSIHFQMLQ